ncbi:hypothetical protein [Halalkalibacter hemicellulosilyticus]|uniref:Uncharacterized protein n=1 Tax=Halalkalibacter hemicellulosilyticusJCM 9152 TaxID=1236971 RepID=W4QKG6_9BACI|nr:hypothetical protein [Halalkalibacter hemicellulosilyticus]GAE32610.1 hypothetical protein JCM9152_4150 [Halalkalibacter hemicellulosilyticusJCM 9152]
MLQATKLAIYIATLFFIGYSYGSLTKDTFFDNFLIMLLSLFIFIFAVELIFSALKKKIPSKDTKEEDPESWSTMMEEVKKDFEKSWDLSYDNYRLHIVNKYNKEQLFIDGKLVSESTRNQWYSWFIPYQTLKANIEDATTPITVKVKLGGWFSLNCKVYVNKKLIFKQKLKYDMIAGGFKDEE